MQRLWLRECSGAAQERQYNHSEHRRAGTWHAVWEQHSTSSGTTYCRQTMSRAELRHVMRPSSRQLLPNCKLKGNNSPAENLHLIELR
jgi:hypothetical protein